MTTETLAAAFGASFLALLLGCEAAELPNTPGVPGAGTEVASDDPVENGTGADDGPPVSTAAAATDDGQPLPDPGDVAPVTEEGRAFTANDPVKGRRSRAAGGYLGAVAGTRFWAEHELIRIQVVKSLQLYQAMDAEGRYPKDNAEFMAKIIKANLINLPELPDGQEYYFDPDNPDMAREPLRIRAVEAE